MAYSRTTWADYPSITTPITAARLNNIEAFLDGMSTIQDAWTTYTPTLTNVTQGTGASLSAAYTQIGKTVLVRLAFTFGTGGSVSGAITVSQPVTSKTYAVFHPFGLAQMNDTGTALYSGQVVYNATTSVRLTALNASGTYLTMSSTSGTVPHTWADTDVIWASWAYEAA